MYEDYLGTLPLPPQVEQVASLRPDPEQALQRDSEVCFRYRCSWNT